MADLINYIQLPFILFLILSIQAISLQIIVGGAGLLSLGHAAFYTIGGYCSAIFTVFIAPKIGIENQALLLLLACLIGMLTAALAGLIIAIPCMKLRGDYLAMATLGVGEIVATIFKNVDMVGGTRGFKDIPKLGSPLLIFMILLITTLFISWFYKTNLGFAIRATRDDEISAKSLGIPIYKVKILAFLIGTALAGLSGVFYAHTLQFISPDEAGLSNSVLLILAVVIGGMYSVWGSILGAFIIITVPELLRFIPELLNPYLLILNQQGYLSENSIQIIDAIFLNRTLIFSVLVLLMMLTNPRGLIALFNRREKEIKI